MKKIVSIIAIVICVIVGVSIGKTVIKSIFDRKDVVLFDEALVEVAKQLNTTLPMQIDKDTRMDSTIAGPGNRLTYLYTLINFSSNELDQTEFTTIMRPQLVNGYKTNPDMAFFRQNKVELHYHYRDKNGNTIATIIISPKDLNK